jgi:DNA-binding NarL/FixJ family response regulator
MKAKILFLDDIFSDRFRKQLSPEHLALDENWVSAVSTALTEQEDLTDLTFEVTKCGDIDAWQDVIEKEKPNVVLLDLFWPEEAFVKYKDRNRGSEISLDALVKIRKAFPDLPIICYTVKPDKELLEEAYSRGATFFLEKLPLALPEVQSPLKYVLIYLLKHAK